MRIVKASLRGFESRRFELGREISNAADSACRFFDPELWFQQRELGVIAGRAPLCLGARDWGWCLARNEVSSTAGDNDCVRGWFVLRLRR